MKNLLFCLLVFLLGSAQMLCADENVQEMVSFKKTGIHKVFVSQSDNLVEKWPAVFPAGTKKLEVVLILSYNPAYGVRLDTAIETTAGKFDLKPQGAPGRFSLFGDYYLTQTLIPASGSFGNGAYSCTVKLNNKNIAKIKWTIGKKK